MIIGLIFENYVKIFISFMTYLIKVEQKMEIKKFQLNYRQKGNLKR